MRPEAAQRKRLVEPRELVPNEESTALEWVPLDDAVAKVLSGEIVNATSVAGILAAAAASGSTAGLRGVDAPWPDEPTALRNRRADDRGRRS